MAALLQANERFVPNKTDYKIHHFMTSEFFTIDYNTIDR